VSLVGEEAVYPGDLPPAPVLGGVEWGGAAVERGGSGALPGGGASRADLPGLTGAIPAAAAGATPVHPPGGRKPGTAERAPLGRAFPFKSTITRREKCR
jgi:hypothetical protein